MLVFQLTYGVSYAVVDLSSPKSTRESPATGRCRGIALSYTMQDINAKNAMEKFKPYTSQSQNAQTEVNINEISASETKEASAVSVQYASIALKHATRDTTCTVGFRNFIQKLVLFARYEKTCV